MADPGESNLEDIFKQAQGPPPGAPGGGEVPHIAPPPGKKLSLTLPIGIFLLIAVIGYFLLIPSRSYPEAGRRAGTFLLAVGHQDYSRAWGMFSDGFKQRLPFNQFESLVAGDPRNWLIDSVDIQQTKAGGPGVVVNVQVANNFQKKARTYPAMLIMVEESGSWKVASIQFP